MTETTSFILTLDDILLRNEWASDIPAISEKKLEAKKDLEILDMCCDLEICATLFIPAVVAKKFPQTIQELSRRGFDIAAHGYYHENLRNMTESQQLQLIDASVSTLSRVAGRKIIGWRTPGLKSNSQIRKAIKQSRILWTSNVTLPSVIKHAPFTYYGNKTEIPIMSSDYALEKGLAPKHVTKIWLSQLGRRRHEIFVLALHPWVEMMQKERLNFLRQFLQTIQSRDDIDFSTCSKTYECSALSGNLGGKTFLNIASRTSEVFVSILSR